MPITDLIVIHRKDIHYWFGLLHRDILDCIVHFNVKVHDGWVAMGLSPRTDGSGGRLIRITADL